MVIAGGGGQRAQLEARPAGGPWDCMLKVWEDPGPPTGHRCDLGGVRGQQVGFLPVLDLLLSFTSAGGGGIP